MRQIYRILVGLIICLSIVNSAKAQFTTDTVLKITTPSTKNQTPYKDFYLSEFGAVTKDSSKFLIGSFDKEMTFAEKTLTPIATGSSYVLKYTKDNKEAWGIFIKGANKPQGAVTVENNLVIAVQIVGKQIIQPATGNIDSVTPKDLKSKHILFINFKPDGSIAWKKLVETKRNVANDIANFTVDAMKLTPSGKILVAGNQNGTVVFGKDSVIAENYNMGQDQGWGTDFFVLRNSVFFTLLNPTDSTFSNTNAIYAKGVGGQNSISLMDAVCDKEDNIFVSAAAQGKISLKDATKKWEVPVKNYNPQNGMLIAKFGKDKKTVWDSLYVIPYRAASKSNQPMGKATSLGLTESNQLIMAGVFNAQIKFSESLKLDSIASGAETDYFFAIADVNTGKIEKAEKFGTESSESRFLNASSTKDNLQMAIIENDVYLMGTFNKTLTTPDDLELSAKKDTTDNFILSYNAESTKWKTPTSFGGDSLDFASHLFVTPNEQLGIAGIFLATADAKANFFGKQVESSKVDEKYVYDSYISIVNIALPKFKITIKEGIQNGTIKTNPENEQVAKQEVEIITEPAKGFRLKEGTLKVYKTGDETTTVEVKNNKFTMPKFNVTITGEFKDVSGIASTKTQQLEIYPNPVSNGFFVQTAKANESIKIYELTGKIIYNQTLNNQKYVEVKGLKSGIYIVKIGNKISKLIKE